MKTTLSSLFLAFCFISQASAQLVVVDATGNTLTSPVTINGAANPNSLPTGNPVGEAVKGYLSVKNTSANTANVRVRFTRVGVAVGHSNNYFCWGTTCYNSTTLQAPNSVALTTNAFTNTNDRCIMYVSGTQSDTSPQYGGTSSFDYTFFEVNDDGAPINPNNSVTVRVNFVITGALSVEDLGVNGVRFAPIFPNPTTGKFTIKAEGIENARQTSLELYTPQGKTITHLPLRDWQNKQHHVALPALSRGMYLYRYVVDGKQSKVGKLIVTE